MKVQYLQGFGLKITPNPKGFDVVLEKSNKLVVHTETLREAENYIRAQNKPVDETKVGSAAEIKGY